MTKVTEYYQKINCDYDAQRCYKKVEIFKDVNEKELGNTKDANSYFVSGNDCLSQQKYEPAIQNYDKAVQINSNYAFAYYNRGNAYKKLFEEIQARIQSKIQADFAKAKELGYDG